MSQVSSQPDQTRVQENSSPLLHLSASTKQKLFGWITAISALGYIGSKVAPSAVYQARLRTTHGIRSESKPQSEIRDELLEMSHLRAGIKPSKSSPEFLRRVNGLINAINKAAALEKKRVTLALKSCELESNSDPSMRRSFRFPAEAASWDLGQRIQRYLPEFQDEYNVLHAANVRRREILLKHLPHFLAAHGVWVQPSLSPIPLRGNELYANNVKYTGAAYIHSTRPLTRTIWGIKVDMVEGETESTKFDSSDGARCGFDTWPPRFVRIHNLIGLNPQELKATTSFEIEPIPESFFRQKRSPSDSARVDHFRSLLDRYGKQIKSSPPTLEETKEMCRIHAAAHWLYEQHPEIGEIVRLPGSFQVDKSLRPEILRGRSEAFATLTEMVYGPRRDVAMYRWLKSSTNIEIGMLGNPFGYNAVQRECFRYLEERLAYETNFKPYSDIRLTTTNQTNDAELDLRTFDLLPGTVKDPKKLHALKNRCLSNLEPDIEAQIATLPPPIDMDIPVAGGITFLGLLLIGSAGGRKKIKRAKRSES